MAKIRRYCGAYILEINNSQIREYCGPYRYTIENDKVREYCGKYLYEIDGFLSNRELMMLIAILFG